jgi:hypothetical protein
MRRVVPAIALFCLVAMPARAATILDLTTAGSTGMIDGAVFNQIDASSTGTGVIDSFVQLGTNADTVQGYNTTVNNVFDNQSSDNFNHALPIADVPIVTVGSTTYRQFFLDINQEGGDPLISLNQILLYQSNTANPSDETFDANCELDLGTLIYSLNDGCTTDNRVELNYNLNTGSGSGDVELLIPTSLFQPNLTYVYLYSKFGIPNNNNDGFEEWFIMGTPGGPVPTPPPNPDPAVPEPATLLLLGSGLLLGARRRVLDKLLPHRRRER